MNKKDRGRILVGEKVEIKVTLNLELLLCELAIESLAQAEKAQHMLERVKYSAATIILAQATVEAYFNFILQHRMLTHDDGLVRLLGEQIGRIYHTLSRWERIIQATAYLATKRRIRVAKATKKKAEQLIKLRNYAVHYPAKPISIKLPRTKEDMVITEAEQKLTPYNARKAVEIAKVLILKLHEKEGSTPPKWVYACINFEL